MNFHQFFLFHSSSNVTRFLQRHPFSSIFIHFHPFHPLSCIFTNFAQCQEVKRNDCSWRLVCGDVFYPFNILRDLLLFLCLLSTCIFANKYFYEDSDCDYSCWGWWWDNRLWIFTLYQILHLRALFKAFSAPFNLLRRIVPTLLGGLLCKGNFCWSVFFISLFLVLSTLSSHWDWAVVLVMIGWRQRGQILHWKRDLICIFSKPFTKAQVKLSSCIIKNGVQ